MGSIAQRTIVWGMALSFAAPFLGFVLVGWLTGNEIDGGPGVGLGALLICGAVLVAAYVVVMVAATLFAWSLWKSGTTATPMQRYWLALGVAYLLAGAAVLAVAVA